MNDSPIYDRLHAELSKRKTLGLFRRRGASLSDARVDLSTNSYLALHDNPDVRLEAERLTDSCFSGNLASRIVSTRSPLYDALEKELADWKKSDTALVFNSGYAANLGIIQALCRRGTEVFCDRLNHASILDGVRLSGATFVRYGHRDMDDLQKRLDASGKKEKLIVTDTVFSMDGDTAPLADICDLARRYRCMLMVDEAHATGVFGKTLTGWVEECGTESGVDVVMGTLSKAIAGLGGYFTGNGLLDDCFVNLSRSVVYSTGLPHSVLAHDLAAVRHVRGHAGLGAAVLKLAHLFREKVRGLGFSTLESSTQIVPCIVRGDAEALELSAFLLSRGIKAPAIRPPTVPKGTSRIRFSVHSGLNEADIEYVIASLREWKKNNV
jgi:8-amino-7-oxononanoate synthase